MPHLQITPIPRCSQHINHLFTNYLPLFTLAWCQTNSSIRQFTTGNDSPPAPPTARLHHPAPPRPEAPTEAPDSWWSLQAREVERGSHTNREQLFDPKSHGDSKCFFMKILEQHRFPASRWGDWSQASPGGGCRPRCGRVRRDSGRESADGTDLEDSSMFLGFWSGPRNIHSYTLRIRSWDMFWPGVLWEPLGAGEGLAEDAMLLRGDRVCADVRGRRTGCDSGLTWAQLPPFLTTGCVWVCIYQRPKTKANGWGMEGVSLLKYTPRISSLRMDIAGRLWAILCNFCCALFLLYLACA